MNLPDRLSYYPISMDPNKKTVTSQITELEEEMATLQKDGSPPKLDEAAALKLDIEQLKRWANEKEEDVQS